MSDVTVRYQINGRMVNSYAKLAIPKSYLLFALLLVQGTCQKEVHKPASKKNARHIGTVTKKTTLPAAKEPIAQNSAAPGPMGCTMGSSTGSSGYTSGLPRSNSAAASGPKGSGLAAKLPARNAAVSSPSNDTSGVPASNSTTLSLPLQEQLPKYYTAANRNDALPELPRLILGTCSDSYGDTHVNPGNAVAKPHDVLKPRNIDVTVDCGKWIGRQPIIHKEHLQGNAFCNDFVQKILDSYGANYFDTIVCERLSLPLDWKCYWQNIFQDDTNIFYDATTSPQGYPTPCKVEDIRKAYQDITNSSTMRDTSDAIGNTVKITTSDPNPSNVFSVESLLNMLQEKNTDSAESEILKQYYTLLKPGGTFYYLSASIGFYTSAGGFCIHNNRRYTPFKDGLNDQNMKAVYRSIFERAGFKDIQFHRDPDFPKTILFLTAIK